MMNKYSFFLNFLLLLLLGQQIAYSTTVQESPMVSNLYPGEKITNHAGFPAIIKFTKGELEKPLVVFIPGTSNLARVSYGYPSATPKDFLSYWLHKRGYSFLAISYSVGNPVFTMSLGSSLES